MLSRDPIVFPESLRGRAAGGAPTRAVVAGAHLPHVLDGVRRAVREGWIDPVFIGPRAGLDAAADEIGWRLDRFETHHADGERAIVERTVAVAAEDACGMVIKGHVHTSALLGGLLRREARMRTGRPLVHVFYLTHPESERALAISDGALIPAPDLTTKKAIVRVLADLFAALGAPRPRIALIAATEEELPHMPATVDAARVTTWARETGVEAEVYGPCALDVAIAPEAARIKGVGGPVAGAADALVAPNIEVGNSLTKTLVWCRSACAAGVVLGGRIPITVPSRSDSPEARLAAVALARIAGAA